MSESTKNEWMNRHDECNVHNFQVDSGGKMNNLNEYKADMLNRKCVLRARSCMWVRWANANVNIFLTASEIQSISFVDI